MSNSSVALRNVSKSFGPKVALAGISVTLGPDTRMGVIGRNGSGKSTLLRIIAGVDEPDEGTVDRMPVSATIGYLPQESERRPDESVASYLERRTGVRAAIDELDEASAALSDASNTAADRYDVALQHYLSLGAADFESRVGVVAHDIGISDQMLTLPMTALSGGQAARVSLAAVLLSRFDLLLLDEPTNDLDFAGLEHLEQFVINAPSGIMVVSHDRAFLEHTTDAVLEIDHAKHTATEYRGGWAAFVESQAIARRHAEERYGQYQSQRKELLGRAQQQKQWADQGVSKVKKSGETDKFIRQHNKATSEKVASKARITEKAMERLDVVEKPWEGWELHMELPMAERSGDVVATLSNAVIERGSFCLGPIDVEVNYGERVAINGPNGSGKTTLLSALLGRAPLQSGEQYVGPSVVIGELDQTREVFDTPATLRDAFMSASLLSLPDACSLLAKFDLGAEHVQRSGNSLSPGERTRAMLALLMARQTNCLVLDEPTNHLDVDAIEQLEAALDTFTGTLLLVTHDRQMIDNVRIDRTIELG